MFLENAIFKISQLISLNNVEFKISKMDDGLLNFYMEGTDESKNVYSLNFITTITQNELLKFKINENINFMNYIDKEDIVFGKNEIFCTDLDITMDIRRYLDNKFLLSIFFDDDSNIIGKLELDFSIE